jgi:hypothetical protein
MVIRGQQRSTPDMIVLGLTAIVGFVICASTCVMLYAAVTPNHEVSVPEIAKQVAELTTSLIAVIVGYVGGRGAAAMDPNRQPPPPPAPAPAPKHERTD